MEASRHHDLSLFHKEEQTIRKPPNTGTSYSLVQRLIVLWSINNGYGSLGSRVFEAFRELWRDLLIAAKFEARRARRVLLLRLCAPFTSSRSASKRRLAAADQAGKWQSFRLLLSHQPAQIAQR